MENGRNPTGTSGFSSYKSSRNRPPELFHELFFSLEGFGELIRLQREVVCGLSTKGVTSWVPTGR